MIWAEWIEIGKVLAISSLYLLTFGLAGISKWFDGGAPQWFIDQFKNTWLGKLPGGPRLQYMGIAFLETLVCVGVIISLIFMEFLPQTPTIFLSFSLILSGFIFVILGFGQRVAYDFVGAANSFFYFGMTMVCLYLVAPKLPVTG